MTVRELGERMDAAEFGEWMDFAAIEPFGCPVEDLRAGQVASTIANANRAKGTDPFKPLDFFPWHREPEHEDPSMQIKALNTGSRRIVRRD